MWIVLSGAGALQGTILGPFLFTLYTALLLQLGHLTHPKEFQHDTAVVGHIGGVDDCEYKGFISGANETASS